MTSGLPMAPLGESAASAAESNDQTSTLGITQSARVFPAGHVNRFLSKIIESSYRPDERTPLVTVCILNTPGSAASAGVVAITPRAFRKNPRRFVFVICSLQISETELQCELQDARVARTLDLAKRCVIQR